MNDEARTGTMDTLRRGVARLRAKHGGASARTMLLSTLLAATEGIGVVLLIPLLALVGLSSGETSRWLDIPTLRELGISTNIYAVLSAFLIVLALRQWVVFRHRVALASVALDFAHGLRADLFASLAAAEWRFFSAGTAHWHAQLLTFEAARSGNTVLQAFTLLGLVLVSALQVTIALLLSAAFTLAALAGLIGFAVFFGRKVQSSAQLGARLTVQNESLYAITSNLLPLLRTTKMAANESELTTRFFANSQAISSTLLAHSANQAAALVKMQFLAALALATALVVGVELLALDALSASILVLIFARLTPLVTQTFTLAQDLAHSLVAVGCSLDSIALWQKRAEKVDRELAPLVEPRESIGLSEICGGYTSADAGPFLCDVSLELRIGSTLLVSGPTGSGKSTLANIIVGLLPPTSGSMSIDGRTLSSAEILQWRRRVGYVDQAVALFTGTLRQNLVWGSRSVDPDWFARVIEACAVTDFIERIQGGLDGSIGEAGAMLSGGEKQRVAMARELIRKPALLVLDEATSGLDEATEARVLQHIADLDPALTMVLISHRPFSRHFADWLVELDRGRIRHSAPAAASKDTAALGVRA